MNLLPVSELDNKERCDKDTFLNIYVKKAFIFETFEFLALSQWNRE